MPTLSRVDIFYTISGVLVACNPFSLLVVLLVISITFLIAFGIVGIVLSVLKTVAFIAGKKNPAVQKCYIRFSIEIKLKNLFQR